MPGVKFSVTQKDVGLEALKRAVLQLERDPHVRVGVFADSKSGGAQHDSESGLTNVEIAAIHEYGAPEAGIPERSFIRSTFEQHRPEYMAILKKMLPRVLEGKVGVRPMFDLIGQKIVADINTKVRSEGVPPPLKPETIARKGSSRTLIDTGRMLASITWVTIA